MSATAITVSHPLKETPLFFRLDNRSQRLVCLSDVMAIVPHWLDDPMQAWPQQLPTALYQPIKQVLDSGNAAQLCLSYQQRYWHVSLAPEFEPFWLITLYQEAIPSTSALSLHLPRLIHMANEQQYALMLSQLKRLLGADRLILWQLHSQQAYLSPLFQQGARQLAPIRADNRYLSALRTRKALRFSETSHQPLLAQHHYLVKDNINARLDCALFIHDKLIAVLSLEYYATTSLTDEMQHIASECCHWLGQWTLISQHKQIPLHFPDHLALLSGEDYCHALLTGLMAYTQASCAWLGEYQWRAGQLWLAPRYALGMQHHAPESPFPLTHSPSALLAEQVKNIYIEDLASQYPQASERQLGHGNTFMALALRHTNGNVLGQLGLLLEKPFAEHHALLALLSQQQERISSELVHLCTQHELRLTKLAFNTHDALLVMDSQGTILKVNGSFCRITGFSEEQILGQSIHTLQPNEFAEQFKQAVYHDVLTQDYWLGEELCLHHGGDYFPIRLMISAVKNNQQQLSHFVLSFYDVSKEKEAAKHIEHLAYYDDLTGLFNRRSLSQLLANTLAQTDRQWSVLIIVDLDNFTTVNDYLGYTCGDELLLAVVTRLKTINQPKVSFARVLGDQFALLFNGLGTHADSAKLQAEQRVKEILALFQTPFPIAEQQLHCSASLGVNLFCSDGEQDHLTLMQQADTATHIAKRQHHAKYVFFTHAMAQQEKYRLSLVNQLRSALHQQQFELYYQPQFTVNEQTLIGVETLIRWRTEQGEMIPPADFIPLAEECNLIQEIGFWVMKTACQQFSRWQSQGLAIEHLSVNVSPRQFHSHEFVQQVHRVLHDCAMEPSCLQLEITESVVLENPLETIAKMEQLKAFGVRISIDDFGTGYSSLAYLRDLPADEVKLDRRFIQTLVYSEQDRAIVRTILDLAKVFDFSVIAEGVEEDAQLAVLKDLCCHYYQGYLSCKPLPKDLFEIEYPFKPS